MAKKQSKSSKVAADAANVVTGSVDNSQKEIKMAIKLAGKKLNVFENEYGNTTFGSEKAPEQVVLRDFNEINGFFNALGFVKDGEFYDLCHGWHMHAPRMTKRTTKDVLYVRWDKLDAEHREIMREDWNIVPEKKQDWFVVNRDNDAFIPGYSIRAYKQETLATIAAEETRAKLIEKGLWDKDDESLPVLSYDELATWSINNGQAWNQLHLHNGVELVLDILDGTRSAAIALSDKESETRHGIVQSKLDNLLQGKDVERQTAYAEAAKNGKERKQNARTRAAMAHNPEVVEEVKAATFNGVSVIVANVKQTVDVSKLVGATVRRVADGGAKTGQTYLPTENAVLAEVRNAGLFKQAIEVVRFAK